MAADGAAAPSATQLKRINTDPERIDLVGAGIDEVGACFARVRLYIGNDSGLMHLAAAAGAPTIGLFGPTADAIYAPWGPKAVTVRVPRSLEQIRAEEGEDFLLSGRNLMEDLAVGTVYDAAAALLAKTAPDDQNTGRNASPRSDKG